MKSHVFVQTAFLGDLILSLPTLKRLKQLYPQDEVILICRKGFGDFFLKLQVVDQCFEITKNDRSSYQTALESLKNKNIENLISAHGSLRTSFFCLQIKSKNKISLRNWLNMLFPWRTVRKDWSLPDPIRQLQLLESLDPQLSAFIEKYKSEDWFTPKQGLLPSVPSWAYTGFYFYLQAGFKKEIMNLFQKLQLNLHGKSGRILIFPGSVWFTKRWLEESYTELAKKLSQDFEVLIMGGPGEEALCQRISEKARVKNLCGQTKVFESLLLMTEAALVIGNDSASSHLASVAEVPALNIWGPTVLKFGYRPWQNKAWIMEDRDLNCRPCGLHGHKKCPKGHFKCMQNITSEEVYKKALSVIHLCNHPH